MRPGTALAVTLLCPTLAFGQDDAHSAGHARAGTAPALGTITFPNSGAAAAQQPFLRGVALLHSFEYELAAESFKDAQRADPGFALAYWAEALTYSHVVWRTENLPASRAVLARLAATPAQRLAKAGSARERAFGAAVEAFYVDAPQEARVRAYADSLRRLAALDTTDLEAAAFASHALMLDGYVGPVAERAVRNAEAVTLALRVAQASPNHPGATHYLIHLFDSPGMAAQGLTFARAYDKIAPDAEHALHMPSHIYLQLGLWDDVVASNERAWAASRAASSNPGDLDWHAFSWLQYGYLQQGRHERARALIDTARALLGSATHAYTDAAFVIPRLEFQYAAETGEWRQPLTRPARGGSGPVSDRERGFRLFATYWMAVDAAQRRDPAFATIAASFLAVVDSARAGGRISPVAASNAHVLRALDARMKGDDAAHMTHLRAAAALERTLTAFVGPPERVFALELLAESLLAAGDRTGAAGAYRDVLRLCPNRARAVKGLARATE